MARQLKSYLGSKFNNYTVISEGEMILSSEDSSQKRHKVRAECECGKKKHVQIRHLKNGTIKSCGCKRWKNLPYNGEKHGMLTVIDTYDREKYNGSICIIKVKCDCGVEKDINATNFSSRKTYSCGCYGGNKIKEGSRITGLYAQHKKIAERRKLITDLTKKQFEKLITSPCYYCGTDVKSNTYKYGKYKQHEFNYMGIDRVDSSVGYVSGNVVSCCKHCNYYKAELSLDDFKSNIKRLYENIYK